MEGAINRVDDKTLKSRQ